MDNDKNIIQQKVRQKVQLLEERGWIGQYELAVGYLRYEAMRRLNALQLSNLQARNLKGENFDSMIDEIIANSQ